MARTNGLFKAQEGFLKIIIFDKGKEVFEMRRFFVLTMFTFVLSAMMLACSSGGGGGGSTSSSSTGKVQLSGSIGSGYQAAKVSSSFFAKALSILGFGTPAYAIGTDPAVDQVLAIPMVRGTLIAGEMANSVSGAINPDKTFSLALATDRDWVIVLINSSATGTNRYVGSLAINTGTADSLLDFPAADATINSLNLGILSRPVSTSNDALSTNSVSGADFNMTSTQLATLAKTDDIFKNAKNIINNYNAATKVWYQLRPDFIFFGDYATIGNSFSGPTYTYINYQFQLDTNSTSVSISQVCGQDLTANPPIAVTKKVLAFYPPADIPISTSTGTITYGPANPIQNDMAVCDLFSTGTATAVEATEWGSMNGDFYATDAYTDFSGGKSMSYGFNVRFSGHIPSGFWDWKEDGITVASFDPSVAAPVTSDGKAKGFVPSLKLTVDGSNNVTAVDVVWWYLDESTNTYLMADSKILGKIVKEAEVVFDGLDTRSQHVHDGISFDPSQQSHIDVLTHGWKYDGQGSYEVFYESGGIGRFFQFFSIPPV
jgi:hypothetical protein